MTCVGVLKNLMELMTRTTLRTTFVMTKWIDHSSSFPLSFASYKSALSIIRQGEPFVESNVSNVDPASSSNSKKMTIGIRCQPPSDHRYFQLSIKCHFSAESSLYTFRLVAYHDPCKVHEGEVIEYDGTMHQSRWLLCMLCKLKSLPFLSSRKKAVTDAFKCYPLRQHGMKLAKNR